MTESKMTESKMTELRNPYTNKLCTIQANYCGNNILNPEIINLPVAFLMDTESEFQIIAQLTDNEIIYTNQKGVEEVINIESFAQIMEPIDNPKFKNHPAYKEPTVEPEFEPEGEMDEQPTPTVDELLHIIGKKFDGTIKTDLFSPSIQTVNLLNCEVVDVGGLGNIIVMLKTETDISFNISLEDFQENWVHSLETESELQNGFYIYEDELYQYKGQENSTHFQLTAVLGGDLQIFKENINKLKPLSKDQISKVNVELKTLETLDNWDEKIQAGMVEAKENIQKAIQGKKGSIPQEVWDECKEEIKAFRAGKEVIFNITEVNTNWYPVTEEIDFHLAHRFIVVN